MGNILSDQYQVTPHTNEHFTSIIIKPTQQLMIVRKTVQSLQELAMWSSKLLKIRELQPQFILLPLDYSLIEEGLCGGTSVMEIHFDHYSISFAEEIAKRKAKEKHMEQEEIWYLALALMSTATICNQLGSRIGNIKPSNILLNNKGNLKILTKFSIPCFEDPYYYEKGQTAFLSPQELLSLKKSYKQNKSKPIPCESFAIGMTLLSAGTLADLTAVYDYQKKEIRMVQLNRYLRFWEQLQFYSEVKQKTIRYSQGLKNMVLNLLDFDPENRLSCLQVDKLISPLSTKILSMIPISVQMPKLTVLNCQMIESKVKRSDFINLRPRRTSIRQKKQDKANEQFEESINKSFSFNAQSVNSHVFQTDWQYSMKQQNQSSPIRQIEQIGSKNKNQSPSLL